MAKDVFGREITDPELVRYQNSVSKEPLATTVGRGVRPVADAVAKLPGLAGAIANQSPKLLGVPAAGIANVVARGVADFQSGFTGEKFKPQQFEGKSFTDLFGGADSAVPRASATASPVGAAVPAQPAAAGSPLSGLNELPGLASVKDFSGAQFGVLNRGLPSPEQIASDKARAAASQAASDARLGITPSGGLPAQINVTRQPNGNLSFTGSGGDGTGAVNYTGLSNFKSQAGGAGQGSVGEGFNLAEQNQRLATALAGFRENDLQERVTQLADDISSGAGGLFGPKRNKAALAELAPLLVRQQENKNATRVANLNAATLRRGQDFDLQAETARTNEATRRTNLDAFGAAQNRKLTAQELDLRAAIALDARSGNPKQVADARVAEVAYMRQTGLTLDGKRLDPGYHAELLKNHLLGTQPFAVGAVGGTGQEQ
jgi:hypothetical protein